MASIGHKLGFSPAKKKQSSSSLSSSSSSSQSSSSTYTWPCPICNGTDVPVDTLCKMCSESDFGVEWSKINNEKHLVPKYVMDNCPKCNTFSRSQPASMKKELCHMCQLESFEKFLRIARNDASHLIAIPFLQKQYELSLSSHSSATSSVTSSSSPSSNSVDKKDNEFDEDA